MFAGKKSAQIREILISESAWEEMTCLFAPSIIPIITATLILNYLNNSERSLVKQILIEDEIIVCATYLIPDI